VPHPLPTPPNLDAVDRAVVFGSCGFLGREVTAQLLQAGAAVLGIDTRPWPGEAPRGYTHSAAGAAALPQARAFLAGGHGAALFLHLAGLADAGVCQREPELARALNVDLVREALEILGGTRCAFVFPSTGIVYGDGLARPATEDDPLLPAAEYARGKIEAEALVRRASEATPGLLCGAVCRLANLYGPESGANTVLGRVLSQARAGGPLQVWDESPVRDFLHVSEAAEGLLRLGVAAWTRGGCHTANLSTGQGTTVGQLVDLCAELFHIPRLPQERPRAEGARPSLLVLDNSRLAALTGWRPRLALRQGLESCLHSPDTNTAQASTAQTPA